MTNQRRITVLIFFYLAASSMFSQTPIFDWAHSFGGNDCDLALSVVADDSGNVYTAGRFSGTVDFDPGSGVYNLTSVKPWNIFIQKLDSNGNFVWAKLLEIHTGTWEKFNLKTDVHGNLYAFGFYYNTVDFDLGNGVYNLTSNGGPDAFILKMDVNGNFVWAKSIGGNDVDWISSIAIDSLSNVYVMGTFKSTIDADPGSGMTNITSSGNFDLYIEKLDSNGNFIKVRRFGGIGADHAGLVKIDKNSNIYLSGSFSDTVDFNYGSMTYQMISNGGTDGFIARLDSGLNLAWVKSIGGTGNDHSAFIELDGKGNIYNVGGFEGGISQQLPSSTVTISSKGRHDVFYQKIKTHDGSALWFKAVGGKRSESVSGMVVSNDNMFVTGHFNDTVDFDPDAGVENLASPINHDFFIQQLDSNGVLVWVKSIGEPTNDDISRSISTDNLGNIYVSGYFRNTVDFDPGTSVQNLTSNGSCDGFTQKFSLECDLEINVERRPGSVSLHSMAERVNYQWIDCATGLPILNANERSYTPMQNGVYAVIISQNDCIDTSDCYPVNNVSLGEFLQNRIADVYPNPAEDEVSISLIGWENEAWLTLCRIDGSIVKSKQVERNDQNQFKCSFNVSDLSKGVYILKLTDNLGVSYSRLLIR